MPLAKLAIKQPVFITMVLLAVTLIGVLAYLNMGVDLYPDMSNPTVSVSVSFPGASPQDVETMITKPLEKALASINGLDSISSTSREGMASVMISFVVGFDIQTGAQEVREQLDSFTRSLPTGAQTPVLRRFDPNSSPFMNAALNIKGNPSPEDARRMVEDVITPRLQSIPGVAAVNVNGLRVQQIKVDLLASKLKALRVAPNQVVSALQTQNTFTPAGRISNPNQDMPLRTVGQYQSLDDIGNIIVAQKGTRNIKLNEVATVNPGYPDVQSYTRVDGQNTMSVELLKQSGSNVVQIATLARDEFASLEKDYPNLDFTILMDDSTFIQQSDHDVTVTLILGALLAFAIVLLFIRNLRNTIITVAGLPIIILATFAVISFLGFTRNIISLMALSLSIGLLIDDAIVVRENIFRHMEGGESPKEAADKGTSEIAFAVLAISLTIVAVFIPVAFTQGQIGRLFKQFGITVSVAILISLFEAFTFAPLLSAYFAKRIKTAPDRADGQVKGRKFRITRIWSSTTSGYKSILNWSIHHRLVILGITAAFFAGAVYILSTFPMAFFPTTESNQISVGIALPPGNSLAKTDQVARDVEQTLMAQPEVTRVYARIGGGSSPYQGNISVLLKEGSNTDTVISRLRSSLSKYSGMITLSKPNQFMGIGFGMGGANVRSRPVVVLVQGPVSLDALDGVANQVMESIGKVPGIRDVAKSLPPQQPELEIIVDRQRAANAGISEATVGSTIRTLIQGTTATQIEWQDALTDVNVRLSTEDRLEPAALMDLTISSPSGTLYPLSALASIQTGTGPTVLSRQNQQEQIVVGANIEGRPQAEVISDVEKAMSTLSLPAGVIWQFSGQQAQTATAFSSLIFALILGLIFVYMVLASQFGSFVHPVTVMVALPLAAIGCALAMLIGHVGLNVISMIGIIMMMGLATKNSILIVDFIIRYRKQGKDREEAVLSAGPVRLRPIMMTSLSIILGMVPTALGMGAAGAFRAPMAIAVIGGVISSTLLSLVVIPVVYTVIDDALALVTRPFRPKSVVPMPVEGTALPNSIGGGGGELETVLNGGRSRRRRWWFFG